MSFRELRDFTESMKALGYPRHISVESFRLPNFELVADALYWLVHRYDPTAEVDENISTENHRVEFLKSIATVMMSKARVKLNIKSLYRADGYAVKELLKLSSLLYEAIQIDSQGPEQSEAEVAKSQAMADMSLAQKLEELKEARSLASELVESGSKLYSLLGREAELKESRDRALTFLDSLSLSMGSDDPHTQIENNIREQVGLIHENVLELQKLREEADKNVKSLKSKIERKQTELERAEKRLQSLKKVKPAFSEEYEQMELELKNIYDIYLERFRNLHYLEFELNKYHSAELEKKIESDKALKRMQKRLREEELRILRGDQPVDEAAIDRDDDVFDSGKDDGSDSGSGSGGGSDEDDDDDSGRRGKKRGQGARGGRPAGRAAAGGRAIGSMAGGDSDEDDSGSDLSDEEEDDHRGGRGNVNNQRQKLGGGGGGGGGSDSDDLSDDDDEEDDDEDEDDRRGGGGSSKPSGGMGARQGNSMGKAPGGPSGNKGRRDDDDDDDDPSESEEDDDDEAF